ncbi:MAG TPA: PAS domain S-box protein, partial [Labilithrix sp.]
MSNGVDVDRTGVPERSSARTRDVLGGTAHVNHIVQFYEADDFLASTVAHFIGSGLLAREPSIIIATPEHHEAFRHALDAASFDVERAHSAGQLVLLDAAQTLATFMVGDAPDWKLFEQNVGAVVARAIASMGGEGVTIRAYGEMVDLLWRRGNGAAAVRLEEMWNELAKHHSFSLLCAYGMTSFGDSEHAETFERVCKAHTHVLPTELYSDLATDDERLRRVGTLEQRSIALENEIHRRSVLERELRQALAATKRAEEDLRDFVENGLEGIHWVGPDGIVLFANQAELDLLGYTRDEYVGKHIRDFHVDDDVIDDILGCLSAGGTLRDREARLRCKDGSIKHVRIHSNVYRRNGKFVHTRCFTRDVTEQKEAEDALRGRTVELEATIRQFNAVVEQMPSAVAIVEAPSGKLLLSNTRSAEIFRLPLAPLADVSAYRRFVGLHEDGRELEPEEWPLARSIATGEVVSGQEIRIVRGDGTRGYIRVSSAPIRDGDGNIVNGVVTYEDVSDEKDAANALREQSRINENLVRIGASLSSELNLDVLVQRVTDEATALCRAQFGAFFHNVVDDKGESYMLYTLSGVPREAFSKFPMPRNTAIFAATFDGEGVVRSDDITKDPRYGKSAPYHGMPQGHLPVCSYLAVPVKSRSGEVLGGLFFGHAEPGRFTEADERLVVAVAAQAAIAIDNA